VAEGAPLPGRPGRGGAASRLGRILRVDHAGELAAVHIYRGQQAVFAHSKPALAQSFKAMEASEAEHLAAFDALLIQRQVRPSLLTPLWRTAAFALGAGTALLGERAAHACTEAVESVIEEHYAGQVEELQAKDTALSARLAGFRDDELGHRDEAVQAGAKDAPGYGLLSAVIRAGCRAAIRVAEKL
jgi:ubiquinone biosynthesis monooxygenase Coq7